MPTAPDQRTPHTWQAGGDDLASDMASEDDVDDMASDGGDGGGDGGGGGSKRPMGAKGPVRCNTR